MHQGKLLALFEKDTDKVQDTCNLPIGSKIIYKENKEKQESINENSVTDYTSEYALTLLWMERMKQLSRINVLICKEQGFLLLPL